MVTMNYQVISVTYFKTFTIFIPMKDLNKCPACFFETDVILTCMNFCFDDVFFDMSLL